MTTYSKLTIPMIINAEGQPPQRLDWHNHAVNGIVIAVPKLQPTESKLWAKDISPGGNQCSIRLKHEGNITPWDRPIDARAITKQ